MRYVVKPFIVVRWQAALAVCAIFATSARAEEARMLRWKFAKGETKRYVQEQEMVSEQTSKGRSMKTTVKQTMDVTWRIKSVDEEGLAEITQTVDRVRMKVQRPPEAGPSLAFDSDEKSGASPETREMAAHFQALLKHPIAMKIDAQGAVSDVEIPDSIKEALEGPEPGSGGEEAFKETFTTNTIQFPAEPVKRGSSWKHATESKTPFGKQKATTTYTYDGIENHEGQHLDKIDLKLALEVNEDDEAKARPKIVSQKSEGVIYFDGEHGWLAMLHSTSKVQTELTQGDMKLGETISTTTRIKLAQPAGADEK
ncbi:MAG TPA: DUF6263 family protein [Pirellulales bacterium]|nr:DUF6263 family protein [Pirellulales bacterium]